MRILLPTLFIAAGFVSGCGSENPCVPGGQSTCQAGLFCETVVGGGPACFPPFQIQGRVIDLASRSGINQSIVQAVDANGASMGTAARSAADGAYVLTVPAARNADGSLAETKVTLRASAAGYFTFPSGVRVAIPIDVRSSTRTSSTDPFVLMSGQTEIALAGNAQTGLGSISGTFRNASAASALIVAEGAKVSTALSDATGAFTLFDLPMGNYTIKAYRVGTNAAPATVTLAAGENRTGVDINSNNQAPGTVSGSVNIVNGGGASNTSVVLVVAATFDDTLKRGDVPPGLRAPPTGGPSITNAFTIVGVPDGTYKVLAAFENDGLVRDPDTSIGGTTIQEVTLPSGSGGRDIQAASSFKVTGALAVVSPGADLPTTTNATPTFMFADDSSEDGYHLEVFNAFGVLHSSWDIPKATGNSTVSAIYQGPALTPGYYQFRATSFRDAGGGRTNISQTEDLRGVFIVE